MVDLGAPIGTHNASEYIQQEKAGFNHGVGGAHASGGIPTGTPIADKFGNSGSTGVSTTDKLENSLDKYGSHGTGSRGAGVGSGNVVGGQYAGTGTTDGLTGQSGAHTTGAGYGETNPSSTGTGVPGGYTSGQAGSHGARDAALAGTAGGAAGGAGALAGDKYASSKSGPTSGATSGQYGSSTDPTSGSHSGSGLGKGAALGAGAGAGAGALAGHHGSSANDPSLTGSGARGTGLGSSAGANQGGISGTPVGPNDSLVGGQGGTGAGVGTGAGAASLTGSSGSGAGKYGRATHNPNIGQPISDPKSLDTGGPHSLVWDAAAGKYVHRRELQGGVGSTGEDVVKGAAKRAI
ncbi:hypothetical protein IAR50_006721 [Cryptococcus sp. DSM 104548]